MAITIQENNITYSSIQSAVDGVCLNGGLTQNRTILVDDGSYYEYVNISGIGANPHLTNGYTLTLKGNGNNVFIDGGGTQAENIRINSIANIVVDKINLINCSQSNVGGANFRVTGASSSVVASNITFKNATIRDGYAASRATTYVNGITYDNVIISGFAYGGLRVGNSPDIIRDLIIKNTTFTKVPISLDSNNSFTTLKGIYSVTISGCIFGEVEKSALQFENCSNINIEKNIFQGHGLSSSAGAAIYAYTASTGATALSMNISMSNNILYGGRSIPISITNTRGTISLINNTITDANISKNTLVQLQNATGSLIIMNNIFAPYYSTVGIIRLLTSTLSTSSYSSDRLYSDNNIYWSRRGTAMMSISSDSTSLPSFSTSSNGLTRPRLYGLDLASTYSISTASSFVGFVDEPNSFLLSATSVGRNTATNSYLPIKDNRNYTRVSPSDIGALDGDGVAPILPISAFDVVYNNYTQSVAFGITPSNTVYFSSYAQYASYSTYEIINVNSGAVITSSSNPTFSYTFNNGGVYTVRQITSNIEAINILSKTSYITVDSLPNPTFSNTQYIIGKTQSVYIISNSTGGTSSNGAIKSYSWKLINATSSVVVLTSTSSTFNINGSSISQGIYNVKLEVYNIVGTSSLTLNNLITENDPPYLNKTIRNQVINVNTLYSYTIENDIFTDIGTLDYNIIAPNWLLINTSSNVISGLTNSSGTYSINVIATDSYGLSNSTTYSLYVNAPPVLNYSLSNQVVNNNATYSYNIPSNIFTDDGIITYSIYAPNWLSVDYNTYNILGVPTSSGNYDIGIQSYDMYNSYSNFTTYSIYVNNKPILSMPISNKTVNVNNSFLYNIPTDTFTDNENITYTTSYTASWLMYDNINRVLYGTATNVGTFSVSYTGTDIYGLSQSSIFYIYVNGAPILNNPILNQYLILGNTYTYTVPSSTFIDNENVSYNFTLPTGFHNSDNIITAMPTEIGTYTIHITATDIYNLYNSTSYSLYVNDYPRINTYNQTQVTNINTQYIFTYSSIFVDDEALTYNLNIPNWLTYSNNTLSGTPTISSTYSIYIKAIDIYGLSNSTTYSLYVNSKPTKNTNISNAMIGVGVLYSLNINNYIIDDGTVSYSLLNSPSWLNIENATISGVSLINGTYGVTLKGTDIYGLYDTITYSIGVYNAPILSNHILDKTVISGSLFEYQIPINTFSDLLSISYSVTNKPTWLSYNFNNRTLSGTPTQSNTYSITVQVINSVNLVANDTFNIIVDNIPTSTDILLLNPIGNQVCNMNTTYSYVIPSDTFYDSTNSLTYSLTTTANWLTMSNNIINGFPTISNTYSLMLNVFNNSGKTNSVSFNLYVNRPPVLSNNISNQVCNIDENYVFEIPSNTFTDDGNISYNINNIPNWLIYDSNNRLISGVPTMSSTYSINITATDMYNISNYTSYNIYVNNRPTINNRINTLYATVSEYFIHTVNNFTDNEILTYTMSDIPSGLKLSNNIISGTPSSSNIYNSRITATDIYGLTASFNFTFSVAIGDSYGAISKIYQPNNKNIFVNEQFIYNVGYVYSSSLPITYSIITKPNWLFYDNINTLFGEPSIDNIGTHSVSILATNGIDNKNLTFSIYVSSYDDILNIENGEKLSNVREKINNIIKIINIKY